MNFEDIIDQVKPQKRRVIAVAAAEDDAVLEAVCEATARGIATPILCGDRGKILALAEQRGLDLSPFAIHHADNMKEAAEKAVELVRLGKADMLMKGLLPTADLLRVVLNKENGLRGRGILSHVSVLHSPMLGRTLLATDAAMVMYPDLKTKAELIKNAVAAAEGLDIKNPKVAPLAAVEVVNPDMPATLDAAMLTIMNQRGQIRGCMVDGPLAMDLALSKEAAQHKGVFSEVAGCADILLFHNIEAANNAVKTFTHAGGCLFGGVVMGAAVPIVLASRSDSQESKLYSISCAAKIADHSK